MSAGLTKQLLVLAALTLAVSSCRSRDATAEAPRPAASVEKAEGPHGLVLTPEQARAADLSIAAAEERSEVTPIRATATVEPVADRQARVGPRIPGRITALRVGVGQRVRSGQPLAVVDSPELGRARADFIGALALANLARDTADREKLLFERRISSEREWREAEAQAIKSRAEKEATENRLHALGVTDAELPRMRVEGHLDSTMEIAAPIEGLVVERVATLGQMVEPKDTLFLVMDLRRVWLLIDVYEQDLSQVRAGQKAIVQLKAVPGESYQGVVDNVGALVDPSSRTVKVRVVLANSRGVLKPGMFATVTIEGTEGEKRRGLYVPSTAVQRMGEEHVVFVSHGENTFEPRRVEVAREGAEWTEIARGLVRGEAVVTRGAFALKSELKKDELGGEEERP